MKHENSHSILYIVASMLSDTHLKLFTNKRQNQFNLLDPSNLSLILILSFKYNAHKLSKKGFKCLT